MKYNMKLATTTHDFGAYRNGNPAEQIKLFETTGFRCLDYSFYRTAQPGSVYLEKSDANWKKELDGVLDVAKSLGMTFVQAHAPDGEHYKEGEKRDMLMLATKRSIEGCAMLGIPSTVVHAAPHPDPDATVNEFIDINVKFYEELYDTAEKFGVNLLIENSCEQNVPTYYLRTGREMKEFLQRANHPLLHACWDTGHAHMRGMDQYQSLVDLGDDLYALHVQDNYGDLDSHVTPMVGNCNFDQVMQALMDIGYKGYYTFEGGTTLRPEGGWPHFRKPFIYKGKEVTKLMNPPEIAQILAVKMMYEIGKFMLEQYGCYEY